MLKLIVGTAVGHESGAQHGSCQWLLCSEPRSCCRDRALLETSGVLGTPEHLLMIFFFVMFFGEDVVEGSGVTSSLHA